MLNKKQLSKWDRLMAAITFAEAGESQTAIKLMAPLQKQKKAVKRPETQNDQRPVLRS